MKKKVYITVIFLVFISLRLIGFCSDYLWLDEVDFMANTFAGEEWFRYRFVPTEPGEGLRIIGKNTWLETLETSLSITTRATTAPWFPVFILHLLTYFFGHHLSLLRLPALLVSLASLYLLFRILNKLFSSRAARYFPLLVFTFSVPTIIYGRSPQPIMYYFLATVIQVVVFLKILDRCRGTVALEDIFRDIRLLTRVSLLVFFLSYMSILICLIFLVYYLILALGKSGRRFSPREYLRLLGEIGINLLPLGILAFLRYRMGDHRFVFGVENPGEFLRLAFASLTYNFNFAYTPGLYKPFGPNPVTWPFIALAILGLIYFFRQRQRHRWPALISLVIFSIFAWREMMPLGGIRHTLVVTPFLYIFAGYGLQGISDRTAGDLKPGGHATTIAGALTLLTVVVFLFSGSRLYSRRESTLNLREIAELARVHDVGTVVGFGESVIVLALMSRSREGLLEERAIRLKQYLPGWNTPPPERHLLVSYRHAVDPPFRRMAWGGSIPVEEFGGASITPLVEEIGPLEPRPDIMAHQSIYYPLNGAFIYLVEP